MNEDEQKLRETLKAALGGTKAGGKGRRTRKPKVKPEQIRTVPENQKSGFPFRVTTEAREPLSFEEGFRPFAGRSRWRRWTGTKYVTANTRRGVLRAKA